MAAFGGGCEINALYRRWALFGRAGEGAGEVWEIFVEVHGCVGCGDVSACCDFGGVGREFGLMAGEDGLHVAEFAEGGKVFVAPF